MCWAQAVLEHKPPIPWLHALLVQLRARIKAVNDRCAVSLYCMCLHVLEHKLPIPWLHALLVQLHAGMKALNDRCVLLVCIACVMHVLV